MSTNESTRREPMPIAEQLAAFVAHARWFGGKGRAFTVGNVRRLHVTPFTPEPTGSPTVTIELVGVDYLDGGHDLYQVPIASYAEPVERLAHAEVGRWEDPEAGPVVAYDAVHDREATRLWLDAFNRSGADEELTFHRLVGYDLDTDAHSSLFSGEQSNSSVAFGEDCLMKVFRRLTPGRNPDIEIHAALTEADNDSVAHLYGWLETTSPPPDGATGGTGEGGEEVYQLAMLQQFLRTASDGWGLALSSVRNLFAEADLHADEVGGDFAGESQRLGASVADVHQVLRDHFGEAEIDPEATAGIMRARLDAAIADVPELAAYAPGVRAVFDRLAGLAGTGSVPAQRVHGDLHLGQTLRTARGWKLVDFEGEPAKSLAERVLPDSPWRDVAGMLRSFDYAARSVESDLGADPEQAAQLAYRGGEWVARNREHFLAGYVEQLHGEVSALSATERLLVDAYEADKAVYEVLYEARNRPAWLPIPLHALERLAHSGRAATTEPEGS